jgi:hypothetical protein
MQDVQLVNEIARMRYFRHVWEKYEAAGTDSMGVKKNPHAPRLTVEEERYLEAVQELVKDL